MELQEKEEQKLKTYWKVVQIEPADERRLLTLELKPIYMTSLKESILQVENFRLIWFYEENKY